MRLFALMFILFLGTTGMVVFAQEETPVSAGEETPVVATPKPTPEPFLNSYKKANGLENWDYTFDVSGLEKGTYNIIIKGTDKAGNVYFEGPVNILIDPDSDLPVVDITNPVNMMRVGGSSLNIVGVCADDDAVAKVEVKIDEGEYAPAQGKDFWSYNFKTEGYTDGVHTITVRGIDINGAVGNEVSRKFQIDTAKPLFEFTNAQSGVLLHGNAKLEANVRDLNGIVSLFYSEDRGETYKQLGMEYKQEESQYVFKLDIDTNRLEDGPQVFWFKSTDNTGSVGYAAFLFFVDNKKPALEIVSPLPDAKNLSQVAVVGTARDEIGLKGLTWEWKDKTGEIELVPGNIYWKQNFDFSGLASAEETVTFTLEDSTGNKEVLRVPVKIDREADKPVVQLLSPFADAVISGRLPVYGFVTDADGAKEITYSIDGKESTTVEAKEGFSLILDELAAGKHKITVTATDMYGTKGLPVTVDFTSTGGNTELVMQDLVSGKSSAPFYPGIAVDKAGNAKLTGLIRDYGGFAKATWETEGIAPKPITLKTMTEKFWREFEIALSPDIPYGVVPITINATDKYDRSFSFTTFVYVNNYTGIYEKPALSLALARKNANDQVEIASDSPLTAYYSGEDIASVSLEPNTPFLSASAQGKRVIITPSQTGVEGTVRISIKTVGGETVTSEPVSVTTVNSPSADVYSAAILKAVSKTATVDYFSGVQLAASDGTMRLEGTVEQTIDRAEVSFNGGKEYKGIDVKRNNNQPLAAISIALPKELPYGKNEFTVRFTNKTKQTGYYSDFFYKIDDPGKTVLNTAEDLYFIDSRITADNKAYIAPEKPLIGFFNGYTVASVEIKPATGFLQASADGRKITITATGEGLSQAVEIVVKKTNGKTFVKKLQFISDAGEPELTLTTPVAEEWYKNSVKIEGTANDKIGIAAVEYALNAEGTYKPMTVKKSTEGVTFSETISLEAIADGTFPLFVKATDNSGKSTVKVIPLKKDTANAAFTLITPQEGVPVNGIFSVMADIADEGRIKTIEFSDDGKTYTPIEGGRFLAYNLDLTKYKKLPEKFYFRVTDMAGNNAVTNPVFNINYEADKPVAEIQIPEEEEVLRNDFVISGMVFDDDGVGAIYFRLDNGEFQKLEGGNSFRVPVKLDEITDNEHTIEVQAEDISGFKGDVIKRKIFISKAEPISTLESPQVSVTTRGTITLAGNSSDANGIKEVYFSFDNGNSFQKGFGAEKWTFPLNTHLLSDGIHRILVKAVDKTSTEGLFATMLNIDNTPPTLSLDFPKDGQEYTEKMLLDGRAFDNIVLSALTFEVSPISGGAGFKTGSSALAKPVELPLSGVFSRQIDVTSLKPGWYNLRIEARDKANNIVYITRNIVIKEKTIVNTMEQVFPVEGENVAGFFTISGKVMSEYPVKTVDLLVDGAKKKQADISEYGYFYLDMGPEDLGDGEHDLELATTSADGSVIKSGKQKIIYTRVGGWVRINNFHTGDFVARRPWLEGEAGFFLDAVDREQKEEFEKYEKTLNKNRVQKVEISLNNGKSFHEVNGTDQWRYRLQTQDIPDGNVRIIMRATVGEKQVITKTMYLNDDKPPFVNLLGPEENQRFNDKIRIVGIASDENRLADISVNLRKGDKSGYSIPEFIQGMYIDLQGTGATLFHLGLGLTFFDQNVKLQFEAGYTPNTDMFTGAEKWPNGLVLGARLIANVFKLPFASFLGPDWEFFSMSLGVGAAFSYFTNSGEEIAFSEDGLIFGAALVQFEFANFTIENWGAFNNFGFYTQLELWFISSAVEGGTNLSLSFGIRARIL